MSEIDPSTPVINLSGTQIVKELALSVPRAFVEHPYWSATLVLSEGINAAIIINEAASGHPFSFEEIQGRTTVATLIGMLGGGALEAVVRGGKTIYENRHTIKW